MDTESREFHISHCARSSNNTLTVVHKICENKHNIKFE